MKKFLAALFICIIAWVCLGNSSASMPIEIMLNGQTVISAEVEISPLSSLILSGVCHNDLDKMGDVFGAKIIAIDALSPKILQEIVKYANGARIEPRSASVAWDGENFDFSTEKAGAFVDVDQVVDSLQVVRGRIVGNVTMMPITPTLTQREVETWTSKIAAFSTSYASSSAARKHNITLAANAIDGYVLKRGGVMSFNTVVGARTAVNGYKQANVILNGQFVQGVGGGVCQVSTTLYNAAVRSGLYVKSSACHSLPVGYVDLGLDAMVSESTDLIISNDTDADVFFSAKADGNIITVTTYSKKSPHNQGLQVSTKIDAVISADYKTTYVDMLDENSLPYEKIIQAKKDGYRVTTYIEKVVDGKRVKTKLRSSYYRPTDGVIEKTNPNYAPPLDGQKDSSNDAGHIVFFAS